MWSLLALLCAAAQAQDAAVDRDIELFRPSADTEGYFAVPSASTLGHLQLGLSLWTHYATDPLVIEVDGERVAADPANASGDEGDGLVDDRLGMNVQVGMGFTRWTSLVLDLPLVAYQDGLRAEALTNAEAAGTALGGGLGDLRITPKAIALHDDDAPVGLAIQLPVRVPTGADGAFAGDGGLGVAPQLVLERANKPVRSREYTRRAAATLGYEVRPTARIRDLRLGNSLIYGAAFALHPAPPVELLAEVHGTVGGPDLAQNPAELLAGARFFAGELVSVRLAGGGGLLPGVGAPDWRVAAGVSVAPNFDPNARDADDDGVSDGLDRCIKEPEDKDKFKDADGCPDPDNDADTIPDVKDACPDDPEDNDGYRDTDGCADNDNDSDQILDNDDRCPFDPESYNGVQDTDGCPDADKPKDTDGDRYTDDIDRCPYDAEDYDQDRDEDGCPDEGRVQVGKDRIQITEVIFFDTGKATIQERSNSLIDELAAVIVAHPELTKIRIEGHTDDVGNDAGNLKLSDARARSVRDALVARGVDVARLDARGFGEMYPLVPNSSEEARAQNRRVEFVIVSTKN
jgi:outer membrane protein OmpA-like peptidoglycan-associated protein